MIRHFKHPEIDKTKWDQTIEHAFNGNIYAFSWFLDLVCPDWEALIEDDYAALMPLTQRKKLGVSYLFQPSFTQQLGVFSTDLLSNAKVAEFLQTIPPKFKVIEINLNKFNNPDLIKQKWIYSQVTHELDLIQPYEVLYKSYSENTKRNLKKAERSGIYVRAGVPIIEVINLFKENTGKRLRPQDENHYKILIRLVNDLLSRNQAAVLGAYSGFNHLCAGGVFIVSHHKVIFIFSGIDETGRESGAMPLLIDHFIRQNASSPLTLDFEGSNNPSLARFYKSFGSTKITYNQYRLNRLPILIRPLFRLFKFMKSMKFKNS